MRLVFRRSLVLFLGVLIIGWIFLSIIVELEQEPLQETLYKGGTSKALILFHPSWIDGFQEDLTKAFADGLNQVGWAVDRQIINSGQDIDLSPYKLVVIGTNTYYWRPDLPTLRILKRLQLKSLPVVGLVGGAGSTGRAERLLREEVVESNGKVVAIHPFWLWRPNDENRFSEPNRKVATDLAEKLGTQTGRQLLDQEVDQ